MAHVKGHKAVFGIYESEEAVGDVIERLKSSAFRIDDVSILIPSKEGSPDFAFEKNSKASQGAVLGVILGLVAAIFLKIFIWSMIALAPVMLIFGTLGALIGLRIPQYEVKRYDGSVRGGGLLFSVHVADSNREKKAKEILKVSGASGISTTGEEKISTSDPRVKSGLPSDHIDPFAKIDNDFRFKF